MPSVNACFLIIFLAISVWHPIASIVMMQPLVSNSLSNTDIAAISLDFFSVFTGLKEIPVDLPKHLPYELSLIYRCDSAGVFMQPTK